MTFGPFPPALLLAIQTGFLERAYIEASFPVLRYRTVADQMSFPGRIGETITKTRMGLMVPNTTPLNPSTNTNIDNGLTPQNYYAEQYTLTVDQYPQVAQPLNIVDDETTIAAFAMQNALALGISQSTAIDRLARIALFNAYMSGNTVVTATLGAPATTVAVDDTRGFQTVLVNGIIFPVSPTNPLAVSINGTLYNVVGFANDVMNISSAALVGGTSGTITTSTNVSVINGTAGNSVISTVSPLVVRPNGRTTTAAILSSDTLSMQTIELATANLRNNAIPTINGAYSCILNQTQMNELLNDPNFRQLTQNCSTRDPVFQEAFIYENFLGVRFFISTETIIQPPQLGAPVPVSQTIQRAIVCGKSALIEGIFDKGLDAIRTMSNNGMGVMQEFSGAVDMLGNDYDHDGMYMYMRPPIDQLGQIISQTSNYLGGFVAPTDSVTTPAIIPTATNSYYKRAVIIETA